MPHPPTREGAFCPMPCANPDPTLDLLRSFDEPGRYIVKENVPIFKPHRRRTKDGREIVVHASDLPSIADKINALENNFGVVMRVTKGHVVPGLSEDHQPTLLGYARQARVATYGPKSEPCILVTLYLLPEQYEAAKQLPYRSPEFYPESGEIRGLALMLKDPFLDMGMVTYQTARGLCYHYALADGDSTTNDESPAGHDEWAAHMEHYAKRNPWVGYAMQCYEGNAMAGPSAPAAGNTQVPTEMPLPSQEAERMAKDQEAVRYAKLEQQLTGVIEENKRLAAQVATLQAERDRAECERLVTQLEAECYQLTRAEEVEALLPLDKPAREKYLARVRKNYQKAPVAYQGQAIPIHDGPVEDGQPAGTTPAEAKAAVSYATKHGCGYDEALNAVRRAKK